MKKVIIILIVLFSFHLESFAERKLAIIKDKDGFTNIRSDKGSQYDIVGQIKSDEFFYCEKTNSDWYFVISLQRYESGEHYGEQLKGYIHKSRILIIEEMPICEQSKIIKDVLEEFKGYNDLFNKFYSSHNHSEAFILNSGDSVKYKEVISSDYIEKRYNPILDFSSKYYCRTNDTVVLNLLFSAIWSDSGSASEAPSSALANCYVCNERSFLNEFVRIANKEQLNFLIDQTAWGLCIHFNLDCESKNITNEEFLRLDKQIEELKK